MQATIQPPQHGDEDMAKDRALVALGGNLPFGQASPLQTVRDALARLEELAEGPILVSRMWRTPAFPAGAGPDFVNAAAAFVWTGSSDVLLQRLHAIEVEFGRIRATRWEARSLDLDLIAHGARTRPDIETQKAWAAMPPAQAATALPDEMILPHPRLAERGFVLVPLAEVAPGWRHPVTGLSVLEMRDALDPAALSEITPIGAP